MIDFFFALRIFFSVSLLTLTELKARGMKGKIARLPSTSPMAVCKCTK